jgi:hypothetical protein
LLSSLLLSHNFKTTSTLASTINTIRTAIMFTSALNLLVQFALLSLAMAAPLAGEVATTSHGNAWQFGAGGGIIGFIVLVLDIIVFSKLSPQSNDILEVFGTMMLMIVNSGGPEVQSPSSA